MPRAPCRCPITLPGPGTAALGAGTMKSRGFASHLTTPARVNLCPHTLANAPPFFSHTHSFTTLRQAKGMFPDGLGPLSKALEAPLIMHMGMWVGSGCKSGPPPYATSSWWVDPLASLPIPGTEGAGIFWDGLFGHMADVGLKVYKLDHSQQQMPAMRQLLQTAGSTELWLRGMAVAADKHGVSLYS